MQLFTGILVSVPFSIDVRDPVAIHPSSDPAGKTGGGRAAVRG